jgi:exodeoxyribonuclease V gamma subunit
MFGLTTLLEEGQVDNLPLGVLPCDSVDFSNCDLLNKWIGLIHSLRDDISPLADGTKLTMKDWAHYLSCLLESYFKPDYDLAESVNDYADLNGQFAILRSAAKSFEETLYPFYSVKTHLDDLLKNRGITYRENHLQAVRFCSMLPLRSIPAKVIAILGLEEGAFPRQNQYSSLNRMLDVKECDYCPLATDLDRYLFLEAIHSAQEFLLLSYQGYSIKDQKELQPSLLVGELYAYLDKYYSLAGKSVSEACLFKHPFNSFDKKYFEQDSVLPNFSVACYASAKICDDLDKVPSHAYLRQFEVGVSQLQEEQEATPIDLKLLSAIARNPIKFHLNRGMDIYLQDPEDRMVKNEEDLVLSPLAKYQMRETAVTTPIELILNRAEQAGQMPFGMFKEVAAQKMKVEKDLLTNAFKKHQIKESDIFQIEFRQGCKSPMQLREDLWILPAPLIHVDGTSRTIVGKLPLVAPQGLIVANKGAVEEIWKIWPQFLLYQMASKSLPFSLEPQVIALHTAKPKKSFFDDPTPYLQAFISYYDMCHKQVSPFMPEWISFIFKQDAVGLQKKMMEEPFKKGRRTEVDFVLNKKELPNVEEIIHNWKPRLDLLAGDFFSAWYPARSKELVEE